MAELPLYWTICFVSCGTNKKLCQLQWESKNYLVSKREELIFLEQIKEEKFQTSSTGRIPNKTERKKSRSESYLQSSTFKSTKTKEAMILGIPSNHIRQNKGTLLWSKYQKCYSLTCAVLWYHMYSYAKRLWIPLER